MSKPLSRSHWSDREIERMLRLRDVVGLSWAEIDAEMNRRHGTCAARYHYEKSRRLRLGQPKVGLYVERGPEPAALSEREIERDLRRAAADRRDITATFCGDPAPGYSALDKRASA